MTATEHLIGLGHRRIGIVCGRLAMLCNQARLDGYRAALERAGLPVDPALIVTEAHRHPSALQAASALLDLPDPPTAIFATSDTYAMGVYEAARLHGLHVPDDLSVVGFDDIPMAAWVAPPLTTMRQPLADMAALGVRLLLGAETQNLSHRMELATGLVVRASTAPPGDDRCILTASSASTARGLADATGATVVLRGYNIGGFLNMENFLTGYPATESLHRAALLRALGPERYALFFDRFTAAFFADEDAAFLASLGMNHVRVPFNYRHFEDDDRPFELKEAGLRAARPRRRDLRPQRALRHPRPARAAGLPRTCTGTATTRRTTRFSGSTATSRTGSCTSGRGSPTATAATRRSPATT